MKWGRWSCFNCFFYIKLFVRYINWIQLAKYLMTKHHQYTWKCSAIYGFWLPLRYGEACLKYVVFLDVLICCLYLITNHFIYDVFKLWSVIVYITYLHHLFNWVTYNSWRQITDYSSKSSSTKYLKLIRLHRNIWVSYLRCWKLVFINDIYFNKL